MSTNKRSLPELRVRLLEIADQFDIEELREIESEMYRRSPTRRAPVSGNQCTAEVAQQIREYAQNNPMQSYHNIAAVFDMNPGRVSEAMRGER